MHEEPLFAVQGGSVVPKVVDHALRVLGSGDKDGPAVDTLVDGCLVQVLMRGWACQHSRRGALKLHDKYAPLLNCGDFRMARAAFNTVLLFACLLACLLFET